MTDGERATVDVVLVRVDAEAVATVDGLRGEGFVDLLEIDVVDGEPVAGEEGRTAMTGPMPISFGVAACYGDAAVDRERRDAASSRF